MFLLFTGVNDVFLLLPRGGKIYQVLREPTLSLHPNSLLTQMAEDQKDDKPIFVEGLGKWGGGSLRIRLSNMFSQDWEI